ncbi:DUF1476 domain-containing protein [Glacieibacterium sp.]|uniref:DUF1476 domain-containing protein n=1 Tax=Glacieibacterium sp. TaxID=2860237 RepID=UPI003B00ADAB
MTTLDNRERAFEDKFARDADLEFKVMARRDRLVGLWAAEKLGKTGEEAAAYAASIVIVDFEEPGEEDVFNKLFADLVGIATEAEIRDHMATTLVEARHQVLVAGE